MNNIIIFTTKTYLFQIVKIIIIFIIINFKKKIKYFNEKILIKYYYVDIKRNVIILI